MSDHATGNPASSRKMGRRPMAFYVPPGRSLERAPAYPANHGAGSQRVVADWANTFVSSRGRRGGGRGSAWRGRSQRPDRTYCRSVSMRAGDYRQCSNCPAKCHISKKKCTGCNTYRFSTSDNSNPPETGRQEVLNVTVPAAYVSRDIPSYGGRTGVVNGQAAVDAADNLVGGLEVDRVDAAVPAPASGPISGRGPSTADGGDDESPPEDVVVDEPAVVASQPAAIVAHVPAAFAPQPAAVDSDTGHRRAMVDAVDAADAVVGSPEVDRVNVVVPAPGPGPISSMGSSTADGGDDASPPVVVVVAEPAIIVPQPAAIVVHVPAAVMPQPAAMDSDAGHRWEDGDMVAAGAPQQGARCGGGLGTWVRLGLRRPRVGGGAPQTAGLEGARTRRPTIANVGRVELVLVLVPVLLVYVIGSVLMPRFFSSCRASMLSEGDPLFRPGECLEGGGLWLPRLFGFGGPPRLSMTTGGGLMARDPMRSGERLRLGNGGKARVVFSRGSWDLVDADGNVVWTAQRDATNKRGAGETEQLPVDGDASDSSSG